MTGESFLCLAYDECVNHFLKEVPLNKSWLILIGAMVVIGLISALLTYFRSEKMSSQADLASKGLAAVQKGNIIFYGILMPLVVGIISFYVYRGMLTRSPETAQTTFLYPRHRTWDRPDRLSCGCLQDEGLC